MKRIYYLSLFVGVLVLMGAVVTQPAIGSIISSPGPSQFEPTSPVGDALHILPPLGDETGKMGAIDSTLTNFLAVTVCLKEGGGCSFVHEFTSQPDQKGMDYIKFQKQHYHVNWDITKGDVGQEFEIHFAVAGLEIGFVHYTPASNRTLPIKFHIDNHPRIRARVLHEQGFTASEVAEVLKGEFGLPALETAQILADETYTAVEIGEALRDVFDLDAPATAQNLKDVGFSAVEVGTALRDVFALDALGAAQILKDVFDLDALDTAQILKDVGYSVDDIYTALTVVYAIDDACELDAIFEAIGFPIGEYLGYTKLCYAQRFAPVLYFDGSYHGLPMSAEDYFQEMLIWENANDENVKSPYTSNGMITWRTEIDPDPGPNRVKLSKNWFNYADPAYRYGMSNENFQMLRDGEVPTYYRMILNEESPHEGRLRIAYWWFYGMQEKCNDDLAGQNDGAHHGDWETIFVTTDQSRTQAEYVTYFFHGHWYTRQSPGFRDLNGRPVVYVGNLGHGSYYSNECPNCWMLIDAHHCCSYADCRNPNEDTKWKTTYLNLVDLEGDSESWLAADRIGTTYEYEGKEYEIVQCLPNQTDNHQCWRWGPLHTYAGKATNASPATHPTVDQMLNWDLASCQGDGCEFWHCKGLKYPCCDVFKRCNFNQGWPWDIVHFNKTDAYFCAGRY